MTARRPATNATRSRSSHAPGQVVTCVAAGLAAVALVAAAAVALVRTPDDARRSAASPPVLDARADLTRVLPVTDAVPHALRPACAPAAVVADVSARPAPEPPREPPRAGTERAFYADDVRLAARPGALDARARQLFAGDGDDNQRVAVLRALWDTATPQAADWFATALRPPTDAPVPMGRVTVAEFALGFLQQRAAREPAALDLLAQLVRDARSPLALRRGAARTAAEVGDLPCLRQLAADVATVADPGLRASVVQAVQRNENAAAAAGMFAPFAETAAGEPGRMVEPP